MPESRTLPSMQRNFISSSSRVPSTTLHSYGCSVHLAIGPPGSG